MCRFALIKQNKFQKTNLLNKFVDFAERSRTLDGDRQGDGMGISYLDEKENWITKKSLKPIWKERKLLGNIPASRIYLVHARSASFAKQKGDIEFNQPFTSRKYAYVFNGFLSGVKIKEKLPGTIGAQKIWHLMQKYLDSNDPLSALNEVKAYILPHTRELLGMNIGLCDGENIYATCNYNEDRTNQKYYQLHHKSTSDTHIISSDPVTNNMHVLKNGQTIRL